MQSWFVFSLVILSASITPVLFADAVDNEPEHPAGRGVYGFTVEDIEGKEAPLSRYMGKVSLVVNVASLCGLTPQYAELVEIYDRYKERGFEILAFPANNFRSQEPGTNAEIQEFCSTRYRVTFPLFSKISVLGEDKAPLYVYLTGEETNPEFAGEIEWNFAKFLVDQEGKVVARFAPAIKPADEAVVKAIEGLLPEVETPLNSAE